MSDPYVLLGVARTRRPWFSELSRWSTSGSAPLEFVKCLSAEEALAVLGTGRRISALIADAATPGVDRDLIGAARSAGVPTLVVTDGRVRRDWDSLGCSAVLAEGFTSDDLLDALERHARPVQRSARTAAHVTIEPEATRSRLIGVTGSGGTGASTVAAALAQSLGRDAHDSIALVDGCRSGDLAMYHDVGDVIPGLPELVEAHRVDHPDPTEVRALLYPIAPRGYDVLLGLRGPRDWVAMRPHTVRAALEGLERSYDLVVVDHDPDLEGEDVTGSVGVEDRHGVARATVERADLVLAVGVPGLKGVNDLVRLVRALLDEGLPAERVLPVVNRCGRSPALRSSVTRTVAELTATGGTAVHPPLFVGVARSVENAHRSAAPLPDSMCRPVGRAVRRRLLALPARHRAAAVGQPLRPGDLGTHADPTWADDRFGRSDVA